MSYAPRCLIAFFLANCTTTFLLANAIKPENSTACSSYKHPYRIAARHIEKGGIGYDQGYTTLEAFFAFNPQHLSTTPFLDIRGHVFNNGKMAANAGLGFRSVVKKRTYGLNAYYDYRNTHRQHYNQVGLGFETLGTLFDVRINGYLPVGKNRTSPYDIAFDQFSGHYALLTQKRQFAMKGANADIGFHFGKSKNFDYYASIGPYYFKNKISYNVWGAKARILFKYKEYIQLELSNSYDKMFHNKFQGQLTFNIPFGPKACAKKIAKTSSSQTADTLLARMLQPVGREEIIVVGKNHQHPKAIDPSTGDPYYFVFVNNTSNSSGTYKSPYHSLSQAQDNSSVRDILYVFPGDGTTKGMNSGITLQDDQKLWGSGVDQLLQTTQGLITIPAQSNTLPSLSNTNVDTLGNVITLASHNAISGIHVTSALNDALYGSDVSSLEISNCLFENVTTFVVESTSLDTSTITFTNNRLINNTNGIFFTLNGTSSLICTNNLFQGQSSESNPPIEIVAHENSFDAQINYNTFNENTIGSIRFYLNHINQANIQYSNNIMTDNGSGSADSLGSNFVVLTDSVADASNACKIVLSDNIFSSNAKNALYLHTDGKITTLDVTALRNSISANGGSGFVLATPVDYLTLVAQTNTIQNSRDNGIAVIAPGLTTRGTITLNHNTITDVINTSNGIAINQDFSNLNLIVQNNYISDCEGTGLLSYAPTGLQSITCDISSNTIERCQNASSNSASGLDLEQFTNLLGSISNNTLIDNTGAAFYIGSTLPNPVACFSLTNNESTNFSFVNPVDGIFTITPMDAPTINTGTINTAGTIDFLNACPVITPLSED